MQCLYKFHGGPCTWEVSEYWTFRSIGSFGVFRIVLPSLLSMSLPAFSNQFHTVDAIHKMGSYPVPREGRLVAAMDKITSQALEGAIIFDKTSPGPRDKYLGFLIDRIFSDFAVDLLSLDELKVL